MNHKKYFLLSIIIIAITLPLQAQSLHQGEPKQLASDIVYGESFNMPMQSALLNSNLLVITDTANEPSIHILEISGPGDVSYKSGLGAQGRGPSEYLAPQSVVQADSEGKLFYVFDAGNRKIVPYTDGFDVTEREIIHLNTDGLPIQLYHTEEGFLFTGIVVDGHVEWINNSGETTGKTGTVQTIDERFTPRHDAQAWHAYSAINNSRENVALFYRNANRAELIDFDGSSIREITSSERSLPDFNTMETDQGLQIVPGDDTITAFIDAASNDEYVYALYSGESAGEESSSYGEYLFVYDWDLELVAEYRLDHDAISVEVDNNGGIYTIQHYSEPALRFVQIE